MQIRNATNLLPSYRGKDSNTYGYWDAGMKFSHKVYSYTLGGPEDILLNKIVRNKLVNGEPVSFNSHVITVFYGLELTLGIAIIELGKEAVMSVTGSCNSRDQVEALNKQRQDEPGCGNRQQSQSSHINSLIQTYGIG
jgi:hypothetical protein